MKTIFVDGIPASWDEDQVKEYLNKFGKIEKVELARNMPSAKRKDFGFVTFDSHDAAVACAEAINNMELGEGNNKVGFIFLVLLYYPLFIFRKHSIHYKAFFISMVFLQVRVRARLSRPNQKGRGKHSARSDHKIARGPSRHAGGYSRGLPGRALPSRLARGAASQSHLPPARARPAAARDRRPYGGLPDRSRHLPPPARSYERRLPGDFLYSSCYTLSLSIVFSFILNLYMHMSSCIISQGK